MEGGQINNGPPSTVQPNTAVSKLANIKMLDSTITAAMRHEVNVNQGEGHHIQATNLSHAVTHVMWMGRAAKGCSKRHGLI